LRALVVDDSRAIRGIIAKIMRSFNFETFEASNGREAMELLQQQDGWDVVTVNWEMPVMDGLELVSKIRADRRFRKLPLLMISSESDQAKVSAAIEEGVDEYLVKPCTPRSIAKKLVAMGLSVTEAAAPADPGPRPPEPGPPEPGPPEPGPPEPGPPEPGPPEPRRPSAPELTQSKAAGPDRASRGKLAPAESADRIRVLVVDDSAVVRRVLQSTLERDGECEVVGAACDGIEGLEFVNRLKPDVILLDVDMPRMDGLEMLRELRARKAGVPVVMFSSRTERGAKTATDALLLGAKDFVFKPGGASMSDVQSGQVAILNELVPRIRWLARQRLTASVAPTSPAVSAPNARVDLVVVASSTGGPAALAMLVEAKELQSNLHAPIVIAQHMPALFTKHLADRLAHDSGLDIAEARDGEVLRPGMIRLAPGGRHAAVRRVGGELVGVVHDGPPVNSCRPSADVLFAAAAETAKCHVLAVVLTGMGHDGRDGCRAIREKGGRILAQDEATSLIWGMPGSVVKEGLADGVLPLDQFPARMAAYLRFGR
jgi:two-component system chemotaxis response regulator CheB